MTNQQFWMKMDQLSASSKIQMEEKMVQAVNLLVLAYKEDLDLYIRTTLMPDGQYHQGVLCMDPKQPNLRGSRFLVCYTSSRAGKGDSIGCARTKARDVLGNMMNKESIGGLIFNQKAGENGVIIIPKFMLYAQLGPVPVPEGFLDNGGIWNGYEVK